MNDRSGRSSVFVDLRGDEKGVHLVQELYLWFWKIWTREDKIKIKRRRKPDQFVRVTCHGD